MSAQEVLSEAPSTLPRAGRRGRPALWSAIAAGVVVVLLIALLATGNEALDRTSQSFLLDQPAPPIEGTLLGGGSYDISDAEGQWLVVNFFATWCVPCREEHGELVRFSESHAEAGDAVVVSVAFDDEADDLVAFFEEQGGDWPVIIEDEGTAIGYGVAQVPESFIVSPDGIVVDRLVGGIEVVDIERSIAANS